MEQKRLVRDLILVAVARIYASPKNATNEILFKALGAVVMAADLSAITYHEADVGQKHLKTAASWRGVRNFPNMGKWEDEALQAHYEFQRVWC